MENELQSINGTVDAVIYQNEDNGYAVIRLVEEDGEEVTAVGTMPQICLGEELMLTGHWTTHASYGEQFLTEYFERRMPATVKGIADYLSSGIIKGIGPKLAKKIAQSCEIYFFNSSGIGFPSSFNCLMSAFRCFSS